jgi:hypothetical protein
LLLYFVDKGTGKACQPSIYMYQEKGKIGEITSNTGRLRLPDAIELPKSLEEGQGENSCVQATGRAHASSLLSLLEMVMEI